MMPLYCNQCAQRVKDRRGCPRDPMATVEMVPPLTGFLWFGTRPDDPFARGKDR